MFITKDGRLSINIQQLLRPFCKHLSKLYDHPLPKVSDTGKLHPAHCERCNKDLGRIKV